MRIGIEITPLTATPTGVGYYVRHLLAALLSQQDAPEYVGFASGLHPPALTDLSLNYRRIPLPTRLLYKCWEHIGIPRVDSLLGGVDMYHAVNYVLPPVTKAKRILSIHDLCFLRHPKWASPKVVGPFQRTIRKHAHEADKVITCSESTKNEIVDLLELPKGRIQVIYDAADNIFQPVDPQLAQKQVTDALDISCPYMLFVGTREPRKNLNGLLKAFSKVSIPHHLVIAGGSGWNSSDLQEQVTRLNLKGKVHFTGYIHDRALFPALYCAATAFLFPSWYEGFGLPVLEAMACGCPVIASNTTSMPEVGGDAALYAPPEESDTWANTIQKVAEDESLRDDMRRKGLEQAAKFSWQHCAKETLECYRSVL